MSGTVLVNHYISYKASSQTVEAWSDMVWGIFQTPWEGTLSLNKHSFDFIIMQLENCKRMKHHVSNYDSDTNCSLIINCCKCIT